MKILFSSWSFQTNHLVDLRRSYTYAQRCLQFRPTCAPKPHPKLASVCPTDAPYDNLKLPNYEVRLRSRHGRVEVVQTYGTTEILRVADAAKQGTNSPCDSAPPQAAERKS